MEKALEFVKLKWNVFKRYSSKVKINIIKTKVYIPFFIKMLFNF